MLFRATLALALLLSAPAQAAEAPSPFDPEAAIRYSQAAIGRQLGDHRFLDRAGKPVLLAELRGQPLVISLVFTACTHTCPLIVESLHRAVEVAQDALGAERFTVLTVGFDSSADTPARMRAYAFSQGVELPNWRFLSADEATIAALTAELGFIYFPSPRGFDHLAQTSVIDREGRVYRHVYGSDFEAPALVEPLMDLTFGRPASLASLAGLIDRVRLFCTLYDPASQRYRFDYSIFIALSIGLISLASIATILIRSLLRAHRQERRA